jgi:hypothetical protein
MMPYRYDYYTIDLSNIAPDFTVDELAHMAINEARERSRLYVIPCEWQVMATEPSIFRVRRKRHAPAKPKPLPCIECYGAGPEEARSDCPLCHGTGQVLYTEQERSLMSIG